MANMSKMIEMLGEEKHHHKNFNCCVCWEEKKFKITNDMFDNYDEPSIIFNGLICHMKHQLCFGCVNKIVKECDYEKCDCIGYNYKCPLCRGEIGIHQAWQLIAITAGSMKTVKEIGLRT